MKLASEGAMREITHANMQLAIEAENVPMSFPEHGGNDVKLAPLVQITDLKEAIFSMLENIKGIVKKS